MNLAAYDKVKVNNNKVKSKINIYSGYPYIITKEVKRRNYYCFVTKYNPDIREEELYLVLLDDKPEDRHCAKTRQDNYGRLKFSMSIIKNKFNITEYNNAYLSLSLITSADDGDIYKIEIDFN